MLTADLKRKSYIWNTISALTNAGQSAVILILIARFYSLEEAGVFSIGYALAVLGMTLAKFGQRSYQVTDVKREYSFKEYCLSRMITMVVTVLLISGYLCFQWLLGQYELEKILLVLFICLWKQIDALEDVYYGMYQQKGRLDLGAKRYSERLIFSTLLFCSLLLLQIPFLIAMVTVVVFSGLGAFLLIHREQGSLLQAGDLILRQGHTRSLLFCSLTLCVSSTLSVYIGNLPKYFIDLLLDDTAQARFGYLILPSFVIMVLSTVLFQPIVREMGEAVAQRDLVRFSGYVRSQMLKIAWLTAAMLICGGSIGIPLLNFLFQVNLSALWQELMLLLLGGGFYALAQFLLVPLVSMRKQRDIALIYVSVAVFSVFAALYFISRYGLLGASLLYLLVNIVLSALLLGDYLRWIRRM